ncbi:secreted RxLR effector protein 161-like [Primulina eburnea]|uniref:secreted RxLR effector protein 161-like n=1 Tax=Primulina eburnea TaxID=1245227 RepID=UPI003C6BDE73
MGSNEKLSKDVAAEDVDNTLYRSIIGSLLYLTVSRPDLMFSVCLCARYQSNPKISHLKAVKRILRYVAGTINLGLWYTHETNSNLVGFSDADWAGDIDDRKSTSGGCFYLGNNLISWHSRKQNCVSLSTAESEYVAVGNACTQFLWMNQMIVDYGLKSEPLMKEDGKSYLKEPNEGCAFSMGATPSKINTEIGENGKSYLGESNEDRSPSVGAATPMLRKLLSRQA